MKLPVTDDGVRPAGPRDCCFYCGALKGSHHPGCVCLDRSVVVELRVRAVVKVPQHWDTHDIEFHRNEGTFCADNDFDALARWRKAHPALCMCNTTEVKHLREATEEDHRWLPVLID